MIRDDWRGVAMLVCVCALISVVALWLLVNT